MAMLKQGAAPWQKPWRVASQMPRTLAIFFTKQPRAAGLLGGLLH